MKKILVLYADMGAGHRSAAFSIGEKLDHDYIVEYLNFTRYARPKFDKLIVNAHLFVVNKLPIIYDLSYSTYKKYTNNQSKLINLYYTKRIYKKLQEINPDMIISTMFIPTTIVVKIKERYKLTYKIINVVTDYHIHPVIYYNMNKVDAYFIPSKSLKNVLISKGIDQDKIAYTGMPIANKFYENYEKDDILNKYDLKDNIKTILFVCGGGAGISKNYKYFKKMLKSNISFQFIFIAGYNNKLRKKVQQAVNKSNKTGQVLGYTNDMAALINIADLVITKAGGILISELMSLNKNTLIIPTIPGQEKENIKYLQKIKFGCILKKDRDFIRLVKKCLKKQEKNIFGNIFKSNLILNEVNKIFNK